jgi:hypothetical protein
MPFGKHKGKPIGYVLNHEPTYIVTFLKRIELREPLQQHIQAAITFHEAGGTAEDPHAPDETPQPSGTVLNR